MVLNKKKGEKRALLNNQFLPASSRKDLLLGIHVTAVDLIHDFFLKNTAGQVLGNNFVCFLFSLLYDELGTVYTMFYSFFFIMTG